MTSCSLTSYAMMSDASFSAAASAAILASSTALAVAVTCCARPPQAVLPASPRPATSTSRAPGMQVPFQGNPPCRVQALAAADRPGVAGRGGRHGGQVVAIRTRVGAGYHRPGHAVPALDEGPVRVDGPDKAHRPGVAGRGSRYAGQLVATRPRAGHDRPGLAVPVL